MTELLHVAPEIAAAVSTGRPVVALESTVITHGLPPPENARTATAMEDAVRRAGATPATIALLRGRPTIGIGSAEIARLAALPRGAALKCSRRDLPVAMARGLDASTTVAATMILAHRAGIRLFATGGIGGVHRGQPQDVSADLSELARTPVAVVCSGPKAILDLPLTLEVLETNGVPVIGYGTETLPGFYTRDTGFKLEARVDTPAEAAAIIAASLRFDTGQGLVIAVPPPDPEALDAATAQQAIDQSIHEAEAAGIRGKAITPFLLARVSELTGGASQRANTALLRNNARVAAEIAVALAALARESPFPSS